MSTSTTRACAAVLALTAAYVGGWAILAPHGFVTAFPLPGHAWVAAEGAYNEHLTRDVGALYLALGAINAWVVVRPAAETMRVVGLAWLVFGVPHLLFHVVHVDDLPTVDGAGTVVTLAVTVLLAVGLVRGAAADR